MKKSSLLIGIILAVAMLVSSCSIVNSITSKISTGGNDGIATVGKLYIDAVWSNNGGQIDALITPAKLAVAGTTYSVQLYEKGNLRASSTVSWNQPQINVATAMIIQFPCSYIEWQAYNGKDLSGTFSIKVIQ